MLKIFFMSSLVLYLCSLGILIQSDIAVTLLSTHELLFSIIALFIHWSSKCKFSLLSTSTLRWLHLSLLQVIGVLCTHILYLSCLTELLNYIIVLFVIHWLFSYFPIHHSTSIFFSIPIQNILATISRISLVRDLASPNTYSEASISPSRH